MRRGEAIAGWLLLAAAFAVTAVMLLGAPVVGVAENGDFRRVMRPAGIVALDRFEDVHHRWVSPRYGIAPWRLHDGFSSAALLAALSKPLRFGALTMDIRQVGALYLLLFAAAFALALAAGVSPLACGLLAWAALDLSYALYWNSFFADPAALLGFLAIALALCAWDGVPRGWRRRLHRALLVAAAATAGWSKQLYVLTPLLVAAVVLAWPRPGWRRHLRAERVTLAALLAVGAAGAWHFTWGGGPRFPAINDHHAVFHGLAMVADDPAAALAELGIAAPAVALAGRHWFGLDAAERQASQQALAGVSRADLAAAYLRAPRRAARALAATGAPLRVTTTAGDPNDSDRARPPRQLRGWWQAARLRGELPLLAGLLLLAGLGGTLAAGARRGWRGVHAALAFLLLNAALLVVASLLGDGLFGLERHLIGARFSLDLALALVLFQAWRGIARRAARPA